MILLHSFPSSYLSLAFFQFCFSCGGWRWVEKEISVWKFELPSTHGRSEGKKAGTKVCIGPFSNFGFRIRHRETWSLWDVVSSTLYYRSKFSFWKCLYRIFRHSPSFFPSAPVSAWVDVPFIYPYLYSSWEPHIATNILKWTEKLKRDRAGDEKILPSSYLTCLGRME